MRILDEDNNKLINSITIMFTPAEINELAGKIKHLDPENGDHIHVNDIDFTRQITVLVYTSENLKLYNEKVRKSIEE